MSLVITDEKKYQRAIRAKAFSEVLEIIDIEDKARRDELGIAYDDGSITVADRIRKAVLKLKGGDKE